MPAAVFKSHAQLAIERGWTIDADCPGTLRIVERGTPFAFVACDGCNYTAAVPVRELDPAIQTARLLAEADLPSRFVARAMVADPDQAPVLRALREWGARECLTPTPVLFGRPGRGKTQVVVMAVRELIARRQIRAWFATAPGLLSDLQAAFGSDAEYNRLWRRAVGVELLVLDDLGAEMDTDWRADRIAALVDERYRTDRPMLATTNIAPARWSEAFDARTASRLAEMSVPVELTGVDRRVTTKGAEF